MFAFIDETGNTGQNLFDESQPTFITAALITRSDFDQVYGQATKALAWQLGAEQLHARQLGTDRLEQVAAGLLSILKKADARFFLSRVEKRYLATTKLVDTIFDSGENLAVPWHAYNFRFLRITLVFKVAYLLDDPLVQRSWACLMEVRREEAYRQFVAVCEELLSRVAILPDARSRQIVLDAVTWARDNPEAIYLNSSSKLARYGHLPNMVAFANLLDGLEMQSEAWNRPVKKIRHDRQMQFEKSLAYWHDLFSNASTDPLYLPGGEKHIARKVFGSEFVISSADSSPGIQIVDVILWSFKRIIEGRRLPPSLSDLMQVVFRRARQHDFSFDGVSRQVVERYQSMMDAPLTGEAEAKAREMLENFESRWQQNMLDYAKRKKLPMSSTS
jgi:hypothetical protein